MHPATIISHFKNQRNFSHFLRTALMIEFKILAAYGTWLFTLLFKFGDFFIQRGTPYFTPELLTIFLNFIAKTTTNNDWLQLCWAGIIFIHLFFIGEQFIIIHGTELHRIITSACLSTRFDVSFSIGGFLVFNLSWTTQYSFISGSLNRSTWNSFISGSLNWTSWDGFIGGFLDWSSWDSFIGGSKDGTSLHSFNSSFMDWLATQDFVGFAQRWLTGLRTLSILGRDGDSLEWTSWDSFIGELRRTSWRFLYFMDFFHWEPFGLRGTSRDFFAAFWTEHRGTLWTGRRGVLGIGLRGTSSSVALWMGPCGISSSAALWTGLRGISSSAALWTGLRGTSSSVHLWTGLRGTSSLVTSGVDFVGLLHRRLSELEFSNDNSHHLQHN